MRIQRFDERFIVRIEAGERVVATLLDFLRREGVGFANLSAAGALRSAWLLETGSARGRRSRV